MRRVNARVVVPVALALIAVALGLFAVELVSTQSASRHTIERNFRQRAELTAALTRSLFQSTAQQSQAQSARRYGGAVSTRALDAAAAKGKSAWIAVLSSDGRILGASRGLTPAARRALGSSPALLTAALRDPFRLSDIVPLGARGSHVLEYAQAFPARAGGRRVVVTAFDPAIIAVFLAGYLATAPHVDGGAAYVVDSRGAVVAGAAGAAPGRPLPEPGLAAALDRGPQGAFGHGRWAAAAPVGDSTWRVALTAPQATLFDSVRGLHKWVPWIIFAAFALVAALAVVLLTRVLRATEVVAESNGRLEALNAELEAANGSLERRAAELARSNAELEQFASIASHDLQEPLRKVRAFGAQIAARESENLSETGRDHLGRMTAAAARMQDLIEDILKFSRVSTRGRPFAPVDLGAVTREVLDDLDAAVAQAGAHVEVGPLPTINADAGQMRQLMQNLISNALKFHRRGIEPEVRVEGRLHGPEAIITVTDNGIGFEPRHAERIFGVFERLHARSEYPGTGIGLALCRKIAERHGGTLRAESAPESGATFTLTLPVNLAQEVVVPRVVPPYTQEADALAAAAASESEPGRVPSA